MEGPGSSFSFVGTVVLVLLVLLGVAGVASVIYGLVAHAVKVVPRIPNPAACKAPARIPLAQTSPEPSTT